MPWFKVDDKLHDHRKARAAGNAAMGVWLLAGSWSADNLTDGFIPASILPRWGRTRDALKLVEVGLWHPDNQDGEDGWRFHEWLERQPSRADKIAERKVRAEAGRIGGLASGQARRGSTSQANGEAKPKQSASTVLEPPSRPVPTRPTATDVAVTEGEFENFWAAYPRKVGKGQARKAWATAVDKVDAPFLIFAAGEFARWCETEHKDEKWIPHPSTWLNGERWTDERRTPKEPTTRVGEHLALVQQLEAKEQRQIGPA